MIFEFPKVERGVPCPFDWENDGRRQRPTRTSAARLALETFMRNRSVGESFIVNNIEVSRFTNCARRLGMVVVAMTIPRKEHERFRSRVWVVKAAQ